MKSFNEINEANKSSLAFVDASLVLKDIKDEIPDSYFFIDTQTKEITFKFPGHYLAYYELDVPDDYDENLTSSQSEILNKIDSKMEKALTREYENFLKKLSKILKDGGDDIEKIAPHLKTSLKFNV